MQTPPISHGSRKAGFTLIDLLTVIAILAIIAALVFPAISALLAKARLTAQLNNGRQIYLAMRIYSSEVRNNGDFPLYKIPRDPKSIVTTSNEAFEMLLPRYLDDKRVFNNSHSAFCQPHAQGAGDEKKVLKGESDWVYVRGLTDTANSQWPLLANAFAPGTTTYVKDGTQKGGVWRGVNAVVVWAGGSAEVVETKEKDGTFYIHRVDKPAANAFEKDGDWLRGENVKVLEPK